ncbi:MAG: GntP family permease [Bacteroidota bacterium]
MAEVLIILLAAIVFIIVSTSWLKIHPFLSLLVTALGVGLAFGLELKGLVQTIASGFGSILAYIGLVIVLGSMLGEMLEKSGGAQAIAQMILQGFGRKRPVLALNLLGAVVGIPVFCDTGFIILSRLSDSIARAKGVAPQQLAVGLAAGLYTSHTLIPPTPGPVAAAGTLGIGDYLGLVIGLGVLVSIPVVLVSNFALTQMKLWPVQEVVSDARTSDTKATLSAVRSVFPILLPIVLIGLGTTVKLSGGTGLTADVVAFVGNPVVALLLAVIASYFVLQIPSTTVFGEMCTAAVKAAGPVLIITGAGGAFGAVLKASDLADSLPLLMSDYQGSGFVLLLLAFGLAALLKTSQGSSTSAIVITSSILGPLLMTLGMTDPVTLSLLVLAIGGGAMTVSHANDSYFWVVNQFGRLTVQDAYRSFSFITLMQGVVTLLSVLALYALLGT